MNCQEKIIAIFRHPYESASSFYKMKKEKRLNGDINAIASNFDLELLRWLSYNIGMLEAIVEVGKEDAIILHHKDYFENSNDAIAKIKTFMKVGEADKDVSGIIDTKLKRYDYKEIQLEENKLVSCCDELYEFLIQLAEGKVTLTTDIVNYYKEKLDSLFNDSTYQINQALLKEENPENYLWRKKMWCLIWMSDQDQIASALDSYFKSRSIRKISVYGKGDLAKELFSIIVKCKNIELINIYDQCEGIKVDVGRKTYQTKNWKETVEIMEDEKIINTVFYYDKVVSILEKSPSSDSILSLYDLLEIIK